MTVKRNYVGIALDKSGSMGMIKPYIINAFNGKVSAICRSGNGLETKLVKTEFNGAVDVKFWNDDISKLPPLDDSSYRPGGGTALWDGIGKTIESLESLPNASDEDTSFLVVVVSDGGENQSRHWTLQRIRDKMRELNKTDRWTFIYVGANQDLQKLSEVLDIPPGNMLGFETNRHSINTMDGMTQAGIVNYRQNLTKGIRSSATMYSTDGTITHTG